MSMILYTWINALYQCDIVYLIPDTAGKLNMSPPGGET